MHANIFSHLQLKFSSLKEARNSTGSIKIITLLEIIMLLELRIISITLQYHLKFNFQLKPPHVMSLAGIYSKVSSLMTSMIGQTTVCLSLAILESNGSNHPSVHSQCASRNVITCPLTCFAPRSLALIRPDLFSVRYTYVGTGSVFT